MVFALHPAGNLKRAMIIITPIIFINIITEAFDISSHNVVINSVVAVDVFV